MSDTLRYFAEQARALNLELQNLKESPVEDLRAFTEQVLTELVALGLLEDTSSIGCYTHYAGKGGDA
ncbi:hypothetical protein [Deinococcus cellulosilyticus]|nr:hypothetical protein [Deinococcus cellulosilyticus]